MIYVNSYADAKAESDICCTSANAAHIAKTMPGDTVIFVPDIFFAQNLEEELKGEKNVVYPGKDNTARGAVCEVHERFTLDDLLWESENRLKSRKGILAVNSTRTGNAAQTFYRKQIFTAVPVRS